MTTLHCPHCDHDEFMVLQTRWVRLAVDGSPEHGMGIEALVDDDYGVEYDFDETMECARCGYSPFQSHEEVRADRAANDADQRTL